LVLTNGCFDLLHAGHVYALEEAAKLGDILWVGINSDASVRRLKGPSRPIYNQNARAYLLTALNIVKDVFIFENTHLAQEISVLKPDVYVKSGDYTLETLNPLERKALEDYGAAIHFIPFLEGWSTTSTIKTICSDCRDD
jgi:rfaE bifunctional protein nucleotidyltransferase chain/domain